jgi:hypothetical protein
MNFLFRTLSTAAILAAIGIQGASAVPVVNIVNDTVAPVNDGVFLDATGGLKTNAFNIELSISQSNNAIDSVGIPNPGVSGTGPVYTNNPAVGTVSLSNLPLNPSNAPYFQLHFNQNEPGAASKISYTILDVLFTVDGTTIWDFDEGTYGAIAINFATPYTSGGNNNDSDIIFNIPVSLILDKGFSEASEFRIYWTADNSDGGTPDQWALVSGSAVQDYNPNTETPPGPSVDISSPAPLSLLAAGTLGIVLLRRRRWIRATI